MLHPALSARWIIKLCWIHLAKMTKVRNVLQSLSHVRRTASGKEGESGRRSDCHKVLVKRGRAPVGRETNGENWR